MLFSQENILHTFQSVQRMLPPGNKSPITYVHSRFGLHFTMEQKLHKINTIIFCSQNNKYKIFRLYTYFSTTRFTFYVYISKNIIGTHHKSGKVYLYRAKNNLWSSKNYLYQFSPQTMTKLTQVEDSHK